MKLFFFDTNFIRAEINFQGCLDSLMQHGDVGAKPALVITLGGQTPFLITQISMPIVPVGEI